MKQIIIKIEDDLHSKFKAWCASKGKSMKEVLIKLMQSKTQ